MLRIAAGFAVTLAVLWIAFLLALLLARPRGGNLRDLKATVPSAIRLLRNLHNDDSLPAGVRRWLRALVVYLAIPIDVIPDFLPVIGYADDVIVVALVLRRVVRVAGADVLDRHWDGPPSGLMAIKRLAGLR